MSDYQRRFKAAETELSEAGIWRSNAIPPYMRLLLRMGLKPVPPHYRPLWRNFLSDSIFFSLMLGVVSISTGDIPGGRSLTEFLVRTIAIGTIVGLVMLAYYISSRKRNGLSRWKDL